VNGASIGTVSAPPYQVFWNTLPLTNGMYQLRAVATDNSGLTAFREVSVSVDDQAPQVAFTAPAASAMVSGAQVGVLANATDDVRVSEVAFFRDSALLGRASSRRGERCSTPAPSPTAPVTLRAEARDGRGNLTTATRTVNVLQWQYTAGARRPGWPVSSDAHLGRVWDLRIVTICTSRTRRGDDPRAPPFVASARRTSRRVWEPAPITIACSRARWRRRRALEREANRHHAVGRAGHLLRRPCVPELPEGASHFVPRPLGHLADRYVGR
jgi:hypothetical protein